jgi:hypothetical protein
LISPKDKAIFKQNERRTDEKRSSTFALFYYCSVTTVKKTGGLWQALGFRGTSQIFRLLIERSTLMNISPACVETSTSGAPQSAVFAKASDQKTGD